MNRRSVALLSGAVVLAAGAIVALNNPLANADEGDRTAADIRALLSRELGDDYAGLWIDKSGVVNVALTDEDKAQLVRDVGAEPKIVEYSNDELDQVKRVLDTREAPATVHRWFVDPVTNSVIVEARRGATDPATTSWLSGARRESPAVKVVEKTKAPRPRANILGGERWEADGAFCTVGFPAVDAGGDTHFTTAAHCATEDANGAVTDENGTRIGVYDSDTDELGDGDFAMVDVDGNDTITGAVDLFDGTAQPIRGSIEAVIGEAICRVGAASGPDFGVECGVVTEKDVTVNTDFGDRFGVRAISGMTGTDVCSDPGDSGGAFFSGDQAQGLLSSGIGFCGEDGVSSHFTPINKALDELGLSLVTSD